MDKIIEAQTQAAQGQQPPELLEQEPIPTPDPLIIGWRFGSGAAIVNHLNNRLQLQFDFGMYPSEADKTVLRKHGFHFAKSQGFAWQRELNMKAVEAAADIPRLWPCSGISPVDLQPDLLRRDLPLWFYDE